MNPPRSYYYPQTTELDSNRLNSDKEIRYNQKNSKYVSIKITWSEVNLFVPKADEKDGNF